MTSEDFSRYQDTGLTEHPNNARTLIRSLVSAAQANPALRETALTIAEGVAREITPPLSTKALRPRNPQS